MTLSVSTPATLQTLRDEARHLLNEFDAADGLAAYYALYHEPKRTTLFVSRRDGQVDGMLARCITGIDLFRPLITLRVRGSQALPALIKEAMAPGRPYLIVVPQAYIERVEPLLTLNSMAVNQILRLDPERFRPQVNALIVMTTAPDGSPRAEVRRGEQVVASAGVNWRSPIFAEVYVQVNEQHRLQGLGRALVNQVVAALLKQKVTPLYVVDSSNNASRAVAEAVGFVDTGAREVMGGAVREA